MRSIMISLAGTFLLAHSALAERLPIKAFTTADGLAHNHVNRIKVDSHGFLWFGTDGGLSRFDGRRFFTLTTEDGLPHPAVNDLIEARDGAFWLATDGGIARFKLRAPATNEKPKIETFRSMEHPVDRFDALEYDSEGRLWAGAYGGLYQIESTSRAVNVRRAGWVVKNEGIPQLMADRRGGLWIATMGGAAYRDPAGKLTPVQPSPFSANAFAETLLQDRQGDVWIGYREGGFCRMAREIHTDPIRPLYCIAQPKFFQQNGQSISDIRSLLQSFDGRLWVGSASALCEFQREDRKLTCYGKAHGLSENWVHRIAEDPEGNLWLATLDSGVMRLTRPGFVQFHTELHSPGAGLYSIETRTGWMVMPGPRDARFVFLELDGRRLTEAWTVRLPAANPPRYQPAKAQGIFEDTHGNWWIPSGRYLHRYPPIVRRGPQEASRMETFELPPDFWYSRLIEDSSGALWASITVPGNATQRHSRWLVVRSKPGELFREVPAVEAAMARVEKSIGIGAYISAFREDRAGRLWMGITSNRRVYPANTVTLLRHERGTVREFSTADGLPAGNVNSIYLDRKGRMWFATQAGLARLDEPLAQRPRFIRYTKADGLRDTEVWCVVEDDQGYIYAGTSMGVDRLDPRTGGFRHFSVEDGLPAGRVWAATRDRQGTLWFVSEYAVSKYEPESLPPRPPAIFTLYPSNSLTLPYNRSHFEAEFASPSFKGPAPRFQYRLLGTDKDWGPPVAESIVRFAGMSPGSYELQARAVNNEGVVSPQPASLRFTVTPPFWRTWWFITMAAGAVIALAYWFHRSRVAQLLAVERLRLQLASDLHDDIGASLSQVSMLGEVAKRSINGDHPALADLIERMSSASREAVSAMGDIVWSIHPKNDHWDGMAQRMRRFASDVLTPKGIDFEFEVPDNPGEPAIGPHARHDLWLIFKESIHNAARHSGATRVRASLHFGRQHVQLVVEDDGRGIDPTTAAQGHGLTTMKTRTSRMGGRCEVSAPETGGTRVAVSIPAKERRS